MKAKLIKVVNFEVWTYYLHTHKIIGTTADSDGKMYKLCPKNCLDIELSCNGRINTDSHREWDVEVVVQEDKEFIFEPYMGISAGFYLDKPKVDENGYLILVNVK